MIAGSPRFRNPRLPFAAILAVSVGAIAGAFIAEHFGIVPCLLCIYQRAPYVLTALIASAALVMPITQSWRRGLMYLCAFVFLGGGALAFFHVGVENHWWAPPAGCGGQISTADSLSELLDGKAPQRRPCDQDVWRLFGVSLAGWNILASMAFALGCYLSARDFVFRRTP